MDLRLPDCFIWEVVSGNVIANRKDFFLHGPSIKDIVLLPSLLSQKKCSIPKVQ